MTMGSPAVLPSSRKTQSSMRRTNKPLVEKKRRARINGCLGQLKSLLLSAMKTEGTQVSRLEKADILEMTVKYLRHIQCQPMLPATTVTPQPEVAAKFSAGYTECASEVIRYMESVSGMTPDIKSRLETHLVGRLHGSVSSTTPPSSSSSPSMMTPSSHAAENARASSSSYPSNSKHQDNNVQPGMANNTTAPSSRSDNNNNNNMSVDYQTAIDLVNMASHIVCKEEANANRVDYPTTTSPLKETTVIQTQPQYTHNSNSNSNSKQHQEFTSSSRNIISPRRISQSAFRACSEGPKPTMPDITRQQWADKPSIHPGYGPYLTTAYPNTTSAPVPPDTPPNTPPQLDENENIMHDTDDYMHELTEILSPPKLMIVDEEEPADIHDKPSSHTTADVKHQRNQCLGGEMAGVIRYKHSTDSNTFQPNSNNIFARESHASRKINFSNCRRPLSTYETPLHIEIPDSPTSSTTPSPPFLVSSQPQLHPSTRHPKKGQCEESLPTIPYGVHPSALVPAAPSQIPLPPPADQSRHCSRHEDTDTPVSASSSSSSSTAATCSSLDNCSNNSSRTPIELLPSEFPWSSTKKQTQIHLSQGHHTHPRPHVDRLPPSPSPPTLTREDIGLPAAPSPRVQREEERHHTPLDSSFPAHHTHMHASRVVRSPFASEKQRVTVPSPRNNKRRATPVSQPCEQFESINGSPTNTTDCPPTKKPSIHYYAPVANDNRRSSVHLHPQIHVYEQQQQQRVEQYRMSVVDIRYSSGSNDACCPSSTMRVPEPIHPCDYTTKDREHAFQTNGNNQPTAYSSFDNQPHNINQIAVSSSSLSSSSSYSSNHHSQQSSFGMRPTPSSGRPSHHPHQAHYVNNGLPRLENQPSLLPRDATRQNCPPLSPVTLRRVMMGQGLGVNSLPNCTDARRGDPTTPSPRRGHNGGAKGHNQEKLCRVPLAVHNGGSAQTTQIKMAEDGLWRPW